MRHAAFSILPPFSILFEFSVHSASVYLTKMSSDESSDREMPYDSSNEEVWEEEDVSGDDDSDGGPGFLDPTRRHLAFTWCKYFVYTRLSVKSRHFVVFSSKTTTLQYWN